MKYGHIEKEALAIVFGCEHFHLYLYGRRFELETDHRPLEIIFKPKLTIRGKPPPARIERWLLRLQEYDFDVIYRPGVQNLADSLSRLPTKTPPSNMEECGDRFVYYLAEQNTPVAMSTEEIRQAAKINPEKIQIRECITNNKSYNLPQSYKLVGDELCITEDIVLRGNRIVLPAKLRPRVIVLAHEDHAGITRCKQRIRSKLWWPKMDKDIENHIKTCHPCQIIGKPERPEPIRPTKLPNACWTHLAIDVCGPFPTGEFVVVLTDYYSRWPEVQILKSITSTAILKWLDSVFATHGYPEEIKSDNASYFTSQEFKETLKSWGVKLHTVTEYWPQANGQVERFNQVLLKHVLTSRASNKDWRITLPTMLRNYRTTPHQTTKETPAKLLMNRELRTKIPNIASEKQVADEELRMNDDTIKEKYKHYADTKRRAKGKDLKSGDFVLLQQKHKNKYSTTFQPDPLEVIQVNGAQIIMKDNRGKIYRRNSSHVKKFLKPDEVDDEDEETTDEEEIVDSEPPKPSPTLPELHPLIPIPLQPVSPVQQHLQVNENPTATPSTIPLRRSERLNKKLKPKKH